MTLQQLESNRFDEVIYDNGEACLIAFTKKNCPVCKEVIPLLEDLQAQHKENFGFYTVDVEKSVNLSQRFSLKGVPSIIFFNDGALKGKLAGQIEEEQVEAKIAATLGA